MFEVGIATDGAPVFGGVGAACGCPICSGQGFASAGSSSAAANKPSLSTTEAALQLTRANVSWSYNPGAPTTVTYSFQSSAPSTLPGDVKDFVRFNAQQITATEAALTAWSDVANIRFERIGSGVTGEGAYSDAGALRFAGYTSGADGAAAFAYLPSVSKNTASWSLQGDSWYNASFTYNANPQLWGYGPNVLVHEIGHAIGLSHPGDYNASATGAPITYENSAAYQQDTQQFSVMSYFNAGGTGARLPGYAASPLLHDIVAAQRLYGANMNAFTGDTVYGFNSNTGRAWLTASNAGSPLIFAVWDAGGRDTLDFSGYWQGQLIDLRPERFSNVGGYAGNVTIAPGAVIENAVGGSGADQLFGNDAGNELRGGAGADTLDGGGGADLLRGEDGDDSLSGGADHDVLYGNQGLDTLIGGAGDDQLFGGKHADRLTGGEGRDFVQGDYGDDLVAGDAGDDVLSGGHDNDRMDGGDDKDLLFGGDGDDTLDGGRGADFVAGDDGRDLITNAGGVDLIFGGAGDDTITAGADGDALLGNADNDLLIGGAGVDTLWGGQGLDTLRGGANGDELYGDKGDDLLFGDDGDDRLQGGAGADQLTGGAGRDRFVFLAAADSAPGAADRIMDFNRHEDLIDLSGIDANSAAAGDQAFIFVAAFTGAAGQATLSYDAANNVSALRLDVDGDGVADLLLYINGSHTTDAGWLL